MATTKPKRIETRHDRIVRQVRAYGLTTRYVVAGTLCNGNRQQALRALQRLVEESLLYRHVYVCPRSGMVFTYYTRQTEPLGLTVLRSCFAVLCYCQLHTPPRKLLSKRQIFRLVASVTPKGTWKLLPWTRVVFEPSSADAPRQVSLIRICGTPTPDNVNLQAVLSGLQVFVSAKHFAPWYRFARANRFVLTCLVPGTDNVLELSAWLERRPLLSSAAGPAQVIPAQVVEARPLPLQDP